MTLTPSRSSSWTRNPPARNPQANTSKRDRSRYLLKTWRVFSVPPIPNWLQACRTRIVAMHALPTSLPFSEPSSVHLLVIGPELAGFDFPPPRGILAVPADRGLQGLAERETLRPSERGDLLAVQGIAAVVPRTVRHVPEQRLGLAQQAQDRLGHLNVRPLLADAEIVD